MKLYEIYNSKYKFISDGTWFKKGSEVVVDENDFLWHLDLSEYNHEEIPYEVLLRDKSRIHGGFRGIRTIENPKAEGGGLIGEDREDGEVCGLDEFEIIKR